MKSWLTLSGVQLVSALSGTRNERPFLIPEPENCGNRKCMLIDSFVLCLRELTVFYAMHLSNFVVASLFSHNRKSMAAMFMDDEYFFWFHVIFLHLNQG